MPLFALPSASDRFAARRRMAGARGATADRQAHQEKGFIAGLKVQLVWCLQTCLQTWLQARLPAWVALVALPALCLLPGRPALAQDFLSPERAFALSGRALDARQLELRFDIAPGYYLYRESLAFQAETAAGVSLGPPQIPAGVRKHDPNFEREVEIYHDSLRIVLPVTQAPARFVLTVRSQGCAEKGVCYPPQDQRLRVSLTGFGGDGRVALESPAAPGSPGGGPGAEAAGAAGSSSALRSWMAAPPGNDEVSAQALLQSGRWGLIVPGFALAGLLLAFTPCVLPMLPILSSILAGGAAGPGASRSRAVVLASAYTLGMAAVYTLLGVLAGLAGEGLAARLQTAPVLIGFGLLLAVLALSMFGVYEFQLPGAWSDRVNAWSQRVPGGRVLGSAAMGGLSALIVSPCVAAPLAGALVYISQTRDVLLGGVALFALACGMGVPLMLLGASAGRWLPRSGPWMETIKQVFGFVLLAVALWIVRPVLPSLALMLAWGAWLLGLAWLLGRSAHQRMPHGHLRPWLRAGAAGLAALAGAGGLLQWGGAALGARDPLAPWAWRSSAVSQTALPWERVRTLAELDARLHASTQPVLLDFYADWCVSCKEMERDTLADPGIRARLQQVTRLQVDVTENNADDQALLRRFRLFGPPGLLFFDRQGAELPLRVIGYQGPERFAASLDSLGW